jgi:HAD superfamily hydrolase (TIGR01459 family)
MTEPVKLLPGLSAITPDYDGFILDLWGVIHDGIKLYDGVVDTMEKLHSAGKSYIMLSNAPRRSSAVVDSMIAMGMPEKFCHRVMSSGEATWRELRDRTDPWYDGIGSHCLLIGPERDQGMLDGLDFEAVDDVSRADIILNTGPWRDGERVEDYQDILERAAGLDVPMLCANPDLVVIRGGRRIICAGALAARYEELGGRVRYLGKPFASIYPHCFEMLGVADLDRVLAVGDSLRTDIAGAKAARIDSLLVLGGIHGDEFGMANGAPVDEMKIGELCARENQKPVAAIPEFIW